MPGAELHPKQLEDAVREVDFTPAGVRAWIEGHVLDEQPPTSAPQGALVFEATDSGQRFIVTADTEPDDALITELRGAAGVQTIRGRATKLEGVEDVIVYLEGIGEQS